MFDPDRRDRWDQGVKEIEDSEEVTVRTSWVSEEHSTSNSAPRSYQLLPALTPLRPSAHSRGQAGPQSGSLPPGQKGELPFPASLAVRCCHRTSIE